MKAPNGRIPLTLRLAARLLPKDAREEVLGDLHEAWLARRETHSSWSVALWALRQPFAALRARRAPKAETPAPTPIRRAPFVGFSWIDVKLGFRMLFKQPILSLVAGLTLAIGIPAALAMTHLMNAYGADLPVDEGDRIVGLRYWDAVAGRPRMQLLHDLVAWRQALTSVEVLGAARVTPLNVHSPDGRADAVAGSEVTASVFDLLRVPPLLGRTLLAVDEVEGAPDVVVISEDLWESRFGRDPQIVGKPIGVGRRTPTVVGVMPAGFRFPSVGHVWLPLRADPAEYEVGEGPDLLVVGRLADGVSRSRAQAELTTVGNTLAAEYPEPYRSLRAEVVPFHVLAIGWPIGGVASLWEFQLLQLLCFALLAVVCGNIGTLILARTAMRLNELSVRTALGASRLRILSQLFVEALVLALGATGAGLVLAQLVFIPAVGQLGPQGGLPYWIDLDLGPSSVVLALAVGAGCAVVAGVLPAIKATSPRIQENLQRNSRGSTLKFGPVTSVLIVTEVALSVGFLCFGTAALMSYGRDLSGQADFDMDRYLLASLRTPEVVWAEGGEPAADSVFRRRAAENAEELRDRIQAEPAVVRVAMGLHVPGRRYPERRISVDGGPEAWMPMGDVHFDYFRDLGLRVVEGRGFSSSDVEAAPDERHPVVVVNEQFVERMLGGGEAVGRTLTWIPTGASPPYPTYDIVGVVETFGTNVADPERRAALYRPMASADRQPMGYVIELANGDATGFIPRLRTMAADVDPAAVVQSPESVADYVERTRLDDTLGSLGLIILSAVGMLLAATGLYALVSVTVSQRTKEIGIRTALGAGAADVVVTIARRAFVQLAVGVALGSAGGAVILAQFANDAEFGVPSVPALIAGVAGAVTLLTVLACLQPTLRGLRIQPTEALGET